MATTRIAPDRLLPVRAGQVFILRDQPVPLLQLADLLHVGGTAERQEDRLVLVIRAGPDLVGIGIDGFLGHTDVLLRPMTGLLAAMPGVLGTTILGDGRVMMVLDLAELAG